MQALRSNRSGSVGSSTALNPVECAGIARAAAALEHWSATGRDALDGAKTFPVLTRRCPVATGTAARRTCSCGARSPACRISMLAAGGLDAPTATPVAAASGNHGKENPKPEKRPQTTPPHDVRPVRHCSHLSYQLQNFEQMPALAGQVARSHPEESQKPSEQPPSLA